MQRYRTLTADELMWHMDAHDFSDEYCVPDGVLRRLKFLERIIEVEEIDESDWDEDFECWLARRRSS